MAKKLNSLDIARSRLHALRAEKPASQMGQLRWAWPDVKAALDHGHSLTTVHQRLAEIGVEIPYRRLSLYIGRLRREQAENLQASPATAAAGQLASPLANRSGPPSAANHPVVRDPLANLRKLTTGRPGFHWDEAPPDKNKLF